MNFREEENLSIGYVSQDAMQEFPEGRSDRSVKHFRDVKKGFQDMSTCRFM